MTDTAIGVDGVAKKKSDEKPKRYGTLIRVSDELAAALREATGLEGVSTAEYGDLHILPMVQKRYKEIILKKAKKMEGKG